MTPSLPRKRRRRRGVREGHQDRRRRRRRRRNSCTWTGLKRGHPRRRLWILVLVRVCCAQPSKASLGEVVGRPRTRYSSCRPQKEQCSPSLEKVAQQRIADALNTLQGRSKLKWTRTPIGDKNIARIANAVQVTICLLVYTSVY